MGIHNFCVLLLVIGICSINCLKAYVAWRRSIEFHSMTRNMNQFAVVQSLKTHTLIIGAGVSGLMCANTLSQSNYSDFMIIDCEKVVGGRVQSEIVEGFILDKGFQVFIDSYPESKQIFDYKKLQLKPFNAGALIRFNGTFHLVADPLRQPQKAWQVVQSPIGSFTDKLKVGVLSAKLLSGTSADGSVSSETSLSTQQYLSKVVGLSELMIGRFFKPFFQGIFLSALSAQSSQMFQFLFKMFLQGSATLPAAGMSAVPLQLCANIKSDQIMLHTRMDRITYHEAKGDFAGGYEVYAHNVDTQQSITIHCQQLVIATDEISAAKLIEQVKPFTSTSNSAGENMLSSRVTPIAVAKEATGRGVTCLYFAFEGPPPVLEPILILNGENNITEGVFTTTINNMCFPSQVSSSYAPPGQSLASVTLVGCPLEEPEEQDVQAGKVGTTASSSSASDAVLEKEVRAQLREWWGAAVVDKWRLLRIYRIPYAQPAQYVPGSTGDPPPQQREIKTMLRDLTQKGLYVCGDHTDTGTMNGALRSGRQAAERILYQK